MNTSPSQQWTANQKNETIHHLHDQLSEVLQRLERIEQAVYAASEKTDIGHTERPIFLGRQFNRSRFALEATDHKRRVYFRGCRVEVRDISYELTEGGTECQFLGREFPGRMLKA